MDLRLSNIQKYLYSNVHKVLNIYIYTFKIT